MSDPTLKELLNAADPNRLPNLLALIALAATVLAITSTLVGLSMACSSGVASGARQSSAAAGKPPPW